MSLPMSSGILTTFKAAKNTLVYKEESVLYVYGKLRLIAINKLIVHKSRK